MQEEDSSIRNLKIMQRVVCRWREWSTLVPLLM
jgi:hypothetical protein